MGSRAPALRISTSGAPSSMIRFMSAASVASPAITAAPTRSAAASFARSRATAVTRAPQRARASTIANPSPSLPPVTTTRFPFRTGIFLLLGCFVYCNVVFVFRKTKNWSANSTIQSVTCVLRKLSSRNYRPIFGPRDFHLIPLLGRSGVTGIGNITGKAFERGKRSDPREVGPHFWIPLHRLDRSKVAPLRVDHDPAQVFRNDEACRDPPIERADDIVGVVAQQFGQLRLVLGLDGQDVDEGSDVGGDGDCCVHGGSPFPAPLIDAHAMKTTAEGQTDRWMQRNLRTRQDLSTRSPRRPYNPAAMRCVGF